MGSTRRSEWHHCWIFGDIRNLQTARWYTNVVFILGSHLWGEAPPHPNSHPPQKNPPYVPPLKKTPPSSFFRVEKVQYFIENRQIFAKKVVQAAKNGKNLLAERKMRVFLLFWALVGHFRGTFLLSKLSKSPPPRRARQFGPFWLPPQVFDQMRAQSFVIISMYGCWLTGLVRWMFFCCERHFKPRVYIVSRSLGGRTFTVLSTLGKDFEGLHEGKTRLLGVRRFASSSISA